MEAGEPAPNLSQGESGREETTLGERRPTGAAIIEFFFVLLVSEI